MHARFVGMMTEKTGWAATGAPNTSMQTVSVSVIPKSSHSHSFFAKNGRLIPTAKRGKEIKQR